jgi:uncharacterized coiled-coil protein SlyX
MVACDATIRTEGHGCCPECFDTDTHGLLDKFKVIDVAVQEQQIQNLNRLAAQTVIGFSEHAKTIRRLLADVDRLTRENAEMRGRLDRAEPGEKQRLLHEVMDTARAAVRNLPERITEVEQCLAAIEERLKIRRVPKSRR